MNSLKTLKLMGAEGGLGFFLYFGSQKKLIEEKFWKQGWTFV